MDVKRNKIQNTFSPIQFIDIIFNEFLECSKREYIYDGIILYGIKNLGFLEVLRSSLEKKIAENYKGILVFASSDKIMFENFKRFDSRYWKNGGYIFIDAGWFINPNFY